MARLDSPPLAHVPVPPTVVDEGVASTTTPDVLPGAERSGELELQLSRQLGLVHAPTSAVSGERSIAKSWSGPPPPDDDHDELVGTTLCSTYVIVRVLGEGGMGRVYEANHTRIANKRFAIKTLHPEFLRQKSVISRFQREAEAAAAISHPHVMGVYDVDRMPDGRPFLVAEHLQGEEFGDLLDRVGKMDPRRVVPIIRQVSKALGAAHEHGIVHRDVKPENVFLTGKPDRPHAKVLDFGISRLDDSNSTQLTKTGMVMGTPAYMAPEQARGERVDLRADIYALGAILYTALTGQVPFDRDDAAATVVAVLTQEPPRPCSIEPSIPESLEFVIQKAMAREPDQRYQSMREFDDALAPFDPSVGAAGAGPASAADSSASDVRAARPLLAMLLLCALLAVVVGLLTTVSGVLRAMGAKLSGVETALLFGGVVLGLITPTVLVIRQVKRTAWNSSLKTLALVRALRTPLLVAGCVYGFSALLIRLLYNVMSKGNGVAWPLWDVALFLAAALAAIVTMLVRKSSSKTGGSPANPFVLALALAATVVATAFGPAMLHSKLAAPGETTDVTSSDGNDDSGLTVPSFSSRERATTDELGKASAAGVTELQALATRYPQDPTVLTALMKKEADTSGGLATAVKTANKLLAMQKEARDSEAVHQVLTRALGGVDHAQEQAFDTMKSKMGSAGPDLLYKISETNKIHGAKAKKLLGEAAVRKKASAALLIALDLRDTKGCRVKLLNRAAKDGDERSLKILRPLTVGKKSGCGFMGLRGCAARCAKDAPAIHRAIKAIQTRASK
jgi:tRNA A-37 threonylcarbamoyl transferase component Bud32